MIHEKLKKIRKGYNLSQAKFAKPLNLAQQTYFKYEKGERSIPHEVLVLVIKTYGVNPDWLFKDEGDPYDPNQIKSDKIWKRLIILRNRTKLFSGPPVLTARKLGIELDTYKKWEMGLEPIPEKIVDQIYAMIQTYVRKEWWYEGKGDIFLETDIIEMDSVNEVNSSTELCLTVTERLERDIEECITEMIRRPEQKDRAVFGELLKIKLREVGVLSAEEKNGNNNK